MARPKKSEAPDLADRVNLTAGAIDRLACPAGKQQAFMRDSEAPGLRVRVTAAGAKSFVYEAKLDRQTIRRTIGDVKLWSIEQARTEARRLAVVLDNGQDPREIERQQQADKAAAKAAAAVQAVTVGEVWALYLEARRPHWGARHHADHVKLVQAGGEVSKRGTRGRGVTVAGPLHPLMGLALRDLTAPVIEAWAAREAQTRPTSARLAWRCLKAFLSWCAEQPEYAPAMPSVNPAKTKKAREALGKAGVKQDALLKEQLPAWFAAVQQIQNPIAAAYLQVLVLTGARPGEVLGLRWEDVNTKWKGLTIRDKVEGERVIPLTPYVSHLLHSLPRRSDWVFPSTARGKDTEGQTLSIPRAPHTAACAVAGIEGLTLHGLRRSFKSLTEWLEIPAGVVAQIMGHKPSATAEKHYTVRPLDLLRVHHERIEAWILEQAGIVFDAKAAPGALRVVAV
ncbi:MULTISPECIES: integrase family protein [unclassified Acidovorax]|uniref:tyrosine-type recombinase/integrase n=1 Tax=unclassified Acidovorax TaxID=2684926 RepID=UPI000BC5F3E5|nr:MULTISPECIES: integrase family protein [unclassified Acidovorax]HQS19677.1 integrase family protein [Acidovorax defluvii]OYY27826.1 MAG: preprotein translocase [Acidovorax sp. 35-64-16]OYZ44604.1 MAG: preprotein translocase [Acidovorax sp. 16-64-162]OYZ68247.1 MAG: preprotein translocase [Acidovorax sp. 24-64-9]OZA69055.1 MAG: preprotein translocase [Acidovorax sp. 39-64-12]